MNTENHYQETDLGNISLNPRGEYNPEESYEYLDLVVLKGGSYVCLAENGATITGISPESGKTTQYWQVITIPGSLTPEYIAMHDRVVNLSEQVGADAVEVRTAEQNVSGMELNVTQMQEQTRQSAEAAEQSKDSSAGYAASADASRQAAEESKQNIDAQVTGFDNHVAEKTGEAENDIEAARIAANKAIIAQQEQSVNEVARAGIEAISTAQSAAQTATEKAQAAATSEKNAAASETAAKLSEENATKMAEQVATDKEQVAYDRTAVENAKQEMTGSVAQIEQNTQGISELKSDIAQIDELDVKILYDSSHSKTNNKLINGYSGSEQDSYAMASTEFIKVDPSSIIYMTLPEVDSVSVSGWAFYDANKEFVLGDVYAEIGTGYYETSIVVPSNASYLRFSFPMSLWSNVKVTVTTKLHDHFKKMKEVKTFYSNGVFDGIGDGVSSTTMVRTDWINVDNYNMVLAIFPPNLKIIVNTADDEGRSNKIHYNSLLERTRNKRVRFAFVYADDSSIQSDYKNYLDDIKIYLVHSNSGNYDISIAPSDAEYIDKEKADIVLSGTNDSDVIQAVFGCRESIKALLYCGTYNVTKIHSTMHDKSCAFSTHESVLNKLRKIEIFGQKGSQFDSASVRFIVSSNLHNSITNETAIFLVPRARDEENTIYTYNTLVRMENINIIGYGYNKPIVYMDFLQAKSAEISRCYIRSDGLDDGLPKFSTIPNSKLTGIRVGHGSNNGVDNSVKHCYVMYCYIGVSCCGEHYIFEDVLTHHCYIGFAFGDKITRTQLEHPNIMIGCSIEGCYRFMLLTKNGVMVEQPFVEDRTNNLWHSSLHVIGLSTESWWGGTLDDLSPAQATHGILEILKGCYTGNIEISSENNEVLESGSCINMGCTHYKDGNTYRKESENLVIVK